MRADYLPLVLADEIAYYVSKSAPFVEAAKTACLTQRDICDIWFDPSAERLIIRKDAEKIAEQESDTKLGGVAVSYLSADTSLPEPSWCGLVLSASSEPKGGYFSTARNQIRDQLDNTKTSDPVKTADTNKPSFLDKLVSISGWNNRYYPTNPIAAMLASGIIGSGIGYGGASLASLMLPSDWDKRRFRRSGLLLGAGLGAAPGAWEAFKSFSANQPLLDGSHMGLENKLEKEGDFPAGYIPPMPYTSGPQINGDDLMKMVWKTPDVRDQLSPGERTLITGAVNGATQVAGSSVFSPSALGRLTLGMGAGYASGLIAGKVLGTLLGMPPDVQKDFARIGMQANAIRSVLPVMFGAK